MSDEKIKLLKQIIDVRMGLIRAFVQRGEASLKETIKFKDEQRDLLLNEILELIKK